MSDQEMLMYSQLSGATRGFMFGRNWGPNSKEAKEAALEVIVKLATCPEHHGCHHFAVTNDGYGVWMSETGVKCLRSQGVDLP